MASSDLLRRGEQAWKSSDNLKISADLFTLTYGSLVVQLLKDYDNDSLRVNERLEKMGFNIGQRIADEFFAKSGSGACRNFREIGEVLGSVAFTMFLGSPAAVTKWSSDAKEFSLELESNPLEDYVELPNHLADLHYSNLICGVVRGALELLHLRVQCSIVADALKGDARTEIRVHLVDILPEAIHDDDD